MGRRKSEKVYENEKVSKKVKRALILTFVRIGSAKIFWRGLSFDKKCQTLKITSRLRKSVATLKSSTEKTTTDLDFEKP